MTDLLTIRATRQAIRSAKTVLMQPKFGLSEEWVKISKQEALKFLAPFKHDETPENAGMFANIFGSVDGNTVFLG